MSHSQVQDFRVLLKLHLDSDSLCLTAAGASAGDFAGQADGLTLKRPRSMCAICIARYFPIGHSQVQEFLLESFAEGTEGLMLKRLGANATYQPSKRSESWIKIKRCESFVLIDSKKSPFESGWAPACCIPASQAERILGSE